MGEGLLQKYIEILKKGESPPHIVLAHFYCELFNIPFDKKTISMLGKVIKLYGVDLVIDSILDMYDMENINLANTYPLLVYFIKKRLESKQCIRPEKDLSDFIKSIEGQMNSE